MFGTYENFQKLVHWNYETGKSESLLLLVKSGCNINCDVCYFKNQSFEMPKNICEKIIKEFSEANITIFINSGEPWFWWDYTKDFLIPTLNKYGGKYGLYTN